MCKGLKLEITDFTAAFFFGLNSVYRGSDPYEHTSSHFAAYFLTSIVMVFAAYALYHNRQKVHVVYCYSNLPFLNLRTMKKLFKVARNILYTFIFDIPSKLHVKQNYTKRKK